jgi:hypothetical protein
MADGMRYKEGFLDYEKPTYGVGTTAGAGTKDTKKFGFLEILGPAAIGAIGSYFTAKSQIGMQERGWEKQLELEQLRIEAQKELERMRNSIDPEIYARLKQELLRPTSPHGMGTAPTGTFRKLLEPASTKLGGQPGTMKPNELTDYLKGGR